ncbi:hypothetical protein [Sandaracinus amylolyticus]|uniref:HEAT repeat protein n=1 Tax=Sandaracinus amylolyticus TaxID=927083 RepID=A0A0F6YM65_9BACT|nr:hypothetical protein [Sandaracinus amylolyticus]AKF11016.1 hypothetical protein DB32_008165 [Sandaracinus amylolyticus]
MSSPLEIERDLAELERVIADADRTGDHHAITRFLWRRLRLTNAEPLLARSPVPLDRIATSPTPVAEWLRIENGARFTLLERDPAERRAEQWSDRHLAQTVATLESGIRAPRGWTPLPLERALASADAWDRIVACAEILERQSDAPEHRAAIASVLDDPSVEVRRWAWLAVVRWSERDDDDSLRDAVRGGLTRDDPEVMPRIAWAAWHLGLADDAIRRIAPSLAASELAQREALQVVRWLGRRDEALRDRIEPLVESPSRDVSLDAISTLGIVAPERWTRLWSFARETTIAPARTTRRGVEVPAREMRTDRAFVAIESLRNAAPELDDEAVAVLVAHAADPALTELLAALGPRARAAVPALVARIDAAHDPESWAHDRTYQALGRIGGLEARIALMRASRTGRGVFGHHLAQLGADAVPAIAELLGESLPEPNRRVVLEVAAALGRGAEPLRELLSIELDAPSAPLRATACAALGALTVDDALAVRLASVFLACTETLPPFHRTYHLAARALAPIWAARCGHSSDLVALRCIEALGTTREYGRAHLDALRALAASQSVRGRAARSAASRIESPEPMFRPNQ